MHFSSCFLLLKGELSDVEDKDLKCKEEDSLEVRKLRENLAKQVRTDRHQFKAYVLVFMYCCFVHFFSESDKRYNL